MARGDYYIVYGRSSCPFCVEAVDLLGSLGIDHDFLDLEEDRNFLHEAKQFYKMKTVPIIVRVDAQHGRAKLIGGCSDLKECLDD